MGCGRSIDFERQHVVVPRVLSDPTHVPRRCSERQDHFLYSTFDDWCRFTTSDGTANANVRPEFPIFTALRADTRHTEDRLVGPTSSTYRRTPSLPRPNQGHAALIRDRERHRCATVVVQPHITYRRSRIRRRGRTRWTRARTPRGCRQRRTRRAARADRARR